LSPQAEHGWWYQHYFATDRGVRGYRTAAAFTNQDHVDIVIHNYRWRLGLAQGEPQYDNVERKLAASPPITVPTITIGSDFDGIGHNVPQEAPQAFADAVVGADNQ
jgi:pimeloyl-ACP methyl ester carboxylesterase